MSISTSSRTESPILEWEVTLHISPQGLGAVLTRKGLGGYLVSQRVSASQPFDTAIVQLRDTVQRPAIRTTRRYTSHIVLKP